MSQTKVLIVDDDNNICELIRLYLEKDKYEVRIAMSGPAALKAFDEFKPELILLDIMLPKINGWHVCKEIRQISQIGRASCRERV